MAKHYGFEDDLFAGELIPPAATFEDTLVLFYGWNEEEADMQVAILTDHARELFYAHGGSQDQLPLSPPSVGELEEELDAQRLVYGSGFTEQIARLTHRYLIGEGEDYNAFTT